ncbi:MAG: TagF domain-containing protein [Rhodoferax sp.]|nr:TagF domain-containing protein [Rhodoferax sp.]
MRPPLFHTWLASPLAVWGKLPSHGDFLRHNVRPDEAHDWHEWSMSVWGPSHHPQQSAARRKPARPQERGWLHLEPSPARPTWDTVPVAFVMQPGTLAFAPRHFVIGSVVDSQDSLGRRCPLVVYQRVSRRWLVALLAGRVLGQGQDMLFWVSRLVARTQAETADWHSLVHAVDTLGCLYQTGWRHLLGAPAHPPAAPAVSQVVQRFGPGDHTDPAQHLQGVGALPWRDGPERVLRIDKPLSAYWQQDLHGGYIHASDALHTLWSNTA